MAIIDKSGKNNIHAERQCYQKGKVKIRQVIRGDKPSDNRVQCKEM